MTMDKNKEKGDILMISENRLGKMNSIGGDSVCLEVGNLKENDVDMEENREGDGERGEKLKILGVVGEKRLEVNNNNDSAKKLFEENTSDSAKRLEENGVIVDSVEEKKRGEKRVVEDCVSGDVSVGNKKKKPKVVDTNEDMKKVAEIVLVLSALGNMRGGRNPTDAEIQFMAGAREKLVGLCEGIAPKDIVSTDAVKFVIEDLGINRPKDQRLGFRPPMMSINEKWQLSKRKSGIYTSTTVQAGFGSKTESHGAFAHSTQRFPPDRPSHIAVSTGAFQTTTSVVHGNEVQSTTRGQFSNPLERDASSLSVPRTEAQHFRLDGRSNVSAHASQVR
ncbi:Phd finger protein, partial [Thalictrum thalictroides]